MTCDRAKQLLALYAGGDLAASLADAVHGHIEGCPGCRNLAGNLERNQSLLRSLRPTTVGSATLAELRQSVMSQIAEGQETFGWRVKLERFFLLGLRKPLYAAAGIAILAILSMTLFAQIQHVGPGAASVAVFEGRSALLRPEGYREWILVGRAVSPGHPDGPAAAENGDELSQNVYINPAAYRDYARTGTFPDGTVMVLESTPAKASYDSESVALKTSVKDSRFTGGWGYFDFTDSKGRLMAKALPETAGCRSCHSDQAETDHVFTQFYPVLRSVSGVL